MTRTASAARRARRWFWALLLVAVGAMGGLYGALRAAPGPGAGLAVVTTSVVLLLSAAQAARIIARPGTGAAPGQRRRGGRGSRR